MKICGEKANLKSDVEPAQVDEDVSPLEARAQSVQAIRLAGKAVPNTETIPNQGSRALIIQQTYRGPFPTVSKPIFAITHS